MTRLVGIPDIAAASSLPLAATLTWTSEYRRGDRFALGAIPLTYDRDAGEWEHNGATFDLLAARFGMSDPTPPMIRILFTLDGTQGTSINIRPIENAAGVLDINKPLSVASWVTGAAYESLLTQQQNAIASLNSFAAQGTAVAQSLANATGEFAGVLADIEQSAVQATATAGMVLRDNLAAITGADGLYKAKDTGYVYQRTGGVNTRLPNLEALSAATLAAQFDQNLSDAPVTITNATNALPDILASFQVMKRVTTKLKGEEYKIPSGQYLYVPQGRHLEGSGSKETILYVTGSYYPVQADAANGLHLAGFTIYRADNTGGGYGLTLKGTGQDIELHDVAVDGMAGGVAIFGTPGVGEPGSATPGTIKNLSIYGLKTRRGCPAAQNVTAYGLFLNDVDGVDVFNMDITGSSDDGVKLRKHARRVTLHGGSSSYNGKDGLDGYGGAQQLTILGTAFNGNVAGGIYLKTGEINTDAAGKYDQYGTVQGSLIVGAICTGNGIMGLELGRNSGAALTQEIPGSNPPEQSGEIPLVADTVIVGGDYSGNGSGTNTPGSGGNGVYVRGRSVRLRDIRACGNKYTGVLIAPEAFDVDMSGAIVRGNGLGFPAAAFGVEVQGQRVTISGGEINGVDETFISQIGGETGKTKRHTSSINVNVGTAQNVLIEDSVRMVNNTGTDVLFSGTPSGAQSIIVNRIRTGQNPEGTANAGPGSRFTRTDGGNGKTAWIKESGVNASGWVRVKPVRYLTDFTTPAAVNVPANSTALQTIALTGAFTAQLNSLVTAYVEGGLPSGVIIESAFVTGTNNAVTVRYRNLTAADIPVPISTIIKVRFESFA